MVKTLEVSSETSRRMSVMGFVCACMVVAIHCTPWNLSRVLTASTDVGSVSWQWWVVNLFLGDGLCRVAVPFFFVASGFFLAGRFGEAGWYTKVVNKRIKTLVVPFVIWAVIGVVFDWSLRIAVQAFCGTELGRDPFENGIFSALVYALGFDLARINIGPIWYLRMLFFLVITSPLIYWGIRRLGIVVPVILFCIYGVYDTTIHMSDFWEYWVSIRGLAYFAIGAAIRMGAFVRFNLAGNRYASHALLIAGGGAMIVNAIARRCGIVLLANFVDFIMVPPIMFAMWMATKHIRIGEMISGNSFAIYVMHYKVIALATIASMGCGKYFGWYMDGLASFLFKFLFSLSLSLCIGILLKKTIPRVSAVLFGGR